LKFEKQKDFLAARFARRTQTIKTDIHYFSAGDLPAEKVVSTCGAKNYSFRTWLTLSNFASVILIAGLV
jgi:hypothetical protein